jgi:peptidoglycan L-alanyl-D-glutamate endopeptidase CwlK
MKLAMAQMGAAGTTAAQLLTLKNAAKKGVPFCEKCAAPTATKATAAAAAAASPTAKPSAQTGNSNSSGSNSNPVNASKNADPVTSSTTWDKYTNTRVQTLDADLKVKATNFINAVEQELGIKLRITQAFRTFAEQNALYAKGRTAPGSVVTNAKGGDSYHNYGLAFDVAIIDNGAVSYNITPEIAAIGARYGLEWGGNWTSFKDKPHFQDTKGQTITQLKKNN